MRVTHSGASQFVGSTKFHQDDKTRENDIGEICSMHGKSDKSKGTGKVYPCTGTEALYRPYGP